MMIGLGMNEYLMLGFEGYKEEGIFWLLSQMLRYWLLGSYIHLINVFFLLFLGCWHISLLVWVCLSVIATRILLYLCVEFSHSTTKSLFRRGEVFHMDHMMSFGSIKDPSKYDFCWLEKYLNAVCIQVYWFVHG